MKQQMSKTLPCGITASGDVHALAQLSAKFQIKARDYGLNDTESLAVWIEGDQYKIETYFGNRSAEYVRALQSGKNNLVNTSKNWEL